MPLRRAALVTTLALSAAALAGAACRPVEGDGVLDVGGMGVARRVTFPWRLLRRHLLAGPPNQRLGLVQGQHIFGRDAGAHLMRGGLVRVRIPARLIPRGDDAWHHGRFPDAGWMERLRSLGVPFKAVIELPVIEIGPHFLFTDEQHAAHAARLAARYRPDVVIIGNEVNVVDGSPGVDLNAVVDRYLHRYAVIHRAIKGASPETRIQLYGEAYYGEPADPNALLRRILSGLRRRGLPPPDLAGMHVYDHAGPILARADGYRRLLAGFGLRIPLSVEELGPRMGVIDRDEEGDLRGMPADGTDGFPNRLQAARADGWILEDEHAELVAQHLATAAAVADQAQIFCAADFRTELQWRRGLISYECGRARPALASFHFMQRLLAGADVSLSPAREDGGVATVAAAREDGISVRIHWSAPRDGETRAAARSLLVPPYTFVCDGRGQLLLPPQAAPRMITLPGSRTPECGGAVRVLL